MFALSTASVALSQSNCKADAVKILKEWHGTYKVSELNLLPKRQRKAKIGYISDAQSFNKVWGAFTPMDKDVKKAPKVNFENEVVVFIRNTEFVNSFSNVKAHVEGGKVTIMANSTRTAKEIEDYVHMVMIVLPRKNLSELSIGRDQAIKITMP
jgi:hypothetical protein